MNSHRHNIAGFRSPARLLDTNSEAGLASLQAQLEVSREAIRVLEKVCSERRLRIRFSEPGQVALRAGGELRLIVRTPSAAYQLRNLLPTLEDSLWRRFGSAIAKVTVGVNPALSDPLPSRDESDAPPRASDREAAAMMREKAKRLPEGSRVRTSLENLAEALECEEETLPGNQAAA